MSLKPEAKAKPMGFVSIGESLSSSILPSREMVLVGILRVVGVVGACEGSRNGFRIRYLGAFFRGMLTLNLGRKKRLRFKGSSMEGNAPSVRTAGGIFWTTTALRLLWRLGC